MQKEYRGLMSQTKKEAYIERLKGLLEEDPSLYMGGSDYEIIYVIEDVTIYGGFEEGYRGIDHYILLSNEVSWEDILQWGTVVVPETEAYISNDVIEQFEALGYERLGLDKNHIMGY